MKGLLSNMSNLLILVFIPFIFVHAQAIKRQYLMLLSLKKM